MFDPVSLTCFLLSISQLWRITEASGADRPFPSWSFQNPNYKMEWNTDPPIYCNLQPTLDITSDYDCIVIGIIENENHEDDEEKASASSDFGVLFDQLDGKYKGILKQVISNDDNKDKVDSRKRKKKEEWQEVCNFCRVKIDGSMEKQRLVICRIQGDPTKDAGKMGRTLGAKLAARVKSDDKKWALLLPPPSTEDTENTDSPLVGAFLSELTAALWADLYKDKRFKGTRKSSTEPDDTEDGSPITLDLIWDHPVVTEPFKVTERETPAAFLERGRASIAIGEALGSGMVLAKDIVNAPHNVLNSVSLADTAQRLAAENPRLSCQIMDIDDCEKHGMGAYLAVARGSETPPKFIHLIYRPPPSKRKTHKLGIVGKGLLFDSGGYNIKTRMMELMKFDCGGAAAVFGAAKAIAKLAPEGVECHFVVAACENMINERAMVPGDILIASNGKTIEVINTDAEGRLTMADALVYADKFVGCEKIIELSTLTGACMVALGNRVAGLWSKDDALVQSLMAASRSSGDKVWHMPLEEDYKDALKSKFADIKNLGAPHGGAIAAALFLNEFVDTKKPYAHIDMAGPVWATKSGATGWGAKLVAEWVCASSREVIEKGEMKEESPEKRQRSLFSRIFGFFEWIEKYDDI